ncbi:MAG: hypothetical protein DMG82_28380 [Acidobacteria bacterium]|nr:MAG: hypothetical protein DMG82_28380 [Acidobacteriota bacterium]
MDVAPPGLPVQNDPFPALTRWANEFRRLRRLGAEAFRAGAKHSQMRLKCVEKRHTSGLDLKEMAEG